MELALKPATLPPVQPRSRRQKGNSQNEDRQQDCQEYHRRYRPS
jgi:hypothetical protein